MLYVCVSSAVISMLSHYGVDADCRGMLSVVSSLLSYRLSFLAVCDACQYPLSLPDVFAGCQSVRSFQLVREDCVFQKMSVPAVRIKCPSVMSARQPMWVSGCACCPRWLYYSTGCARRQTPRKCRQILKMNFYRDFSGFLCFSKFFITGQFFHIPAENKMKR